MAAGNFSSHYLGFPFSVQVASESIKIYNAISDGTVNLVDKVKDNLESILIERNESSTKITD